MILHDDHAAMADWLLLIIDDSPDDRAEMRRMLLSGSDRRLTFLEASSGQAGIDAVNNAERPPDCILLDFNLPDMDAPEVLAELAGPDGVLRWPVVVVTGGATRADGRLVLRAGAHDYIGKDWTSPQSLNRAMENASESWAMARELRERRNAMRQVEERDAFRGAFSEATGKLKDPAALKTVATRLLGVYLRSSRVVYGNTLDNGLVGVEPGYVDGVMPIQGVHQLDDYGPQLLALLRSGSAVVSHDVPRDPAYSDAEKRNYADFEVGAHVAVPLRKNGVLDAVLAVHQKVARNWSAEEIALITEIAERIWSAVEHARAEARLATSELQLLQMIDIMPSFAAVLRGPKHVFALANLPYYAVAGHGPEIIGKELLQAMPELANQPFPALLDTVYRNGERFDAVNMSARIPRGPGGSMVDLTIDFSYLPLREPDGSVSGIFIHGVDRTAEFRTAQTLSRQARELRILADNIPDVLSRFDRGLRHVFVNSVIEKITGCKISDIIGKTNRELDMPGLQCDQWDQALTAVFESGLHRTLEFSYLTINGLRHYAARLVPEFNESGVIESVLGITHDVTHRKAFEQQLMEQDRRKDEFLATLAHELRNPLAPIRTGLQLLKLEPSAETSARTLLVMERQLGQMVRLIDDLLDVSRITSGKIVLKRQPVLLQEVAATAVEAARSMIDAASHTLTIDWPAEPVWLDADATRLSQILSNLLTNSAKYTGPGGRIRFAARREAGHVLISVADSGMGIPRNMLHTVFDMFTQINRTLDRAQGGLGIGLSLVKRLVEMHGGSVSAASGGIDQGSEFTVRLAVVQAPNQIAVVAAPPAAVPAASGQRILVVDDNVDAAETMAMLLDLSGYDTRTAFGGREALRVARDFQPAVVFLDIGLPGMNGYEVAQNLRGDPATASATLIALTGWGTEEDLRKSRMAGFDAHLTKPVGPQQVEDLLAKFLPAQQA